MKRFKNIKNKLKIAKLTSFFNENSLMQEAILNAFKNLSVLIDRCL